MSDIVNCVLRVLIRAHIYFIERVRGVIHIYSSSSSSSTIKRGEMNVQLSLCDVLCQVKQPQTNKRLVPETEASAEHRRRCVWRIRAHFVFLSSTPTATNIKQA
mmetsp:Transcript_16807/g.47141  ORF Transcript_16807/g.47141 Transcript_16807/m.47141 type:complete len:104 (-) Transcript_16807:496-807(-)